MYQLIPTRRQPQDRTKQGIRYVLPAPVLLVSGIMHDIINVAEELHGFCGFVVQLLLAGCDV
jgi:hypothetical protein